MRIIKKRDVICTTHAIFGVFLVTLLYEVFPAINTHIPFVNAAGIAAIASLIPDLDHPKGYLSRGNWSFISIAIRRTTMHRGWTHSLVGAMVFTLLSLIVFLQLNANPLYTFPFFLGYTSHLLSDSLNPTGVNWLWPWNRKKFRIASIRTGSKEEAILHNALLVLEVILLAINPQY